jgi:hypothetical protein
MNQGIKPFFLIEIQNRNFSFTTDKLMKYLMKLEKNQKEINKISKDQIQLVIG